MGYSWKNLKVNRFAGLDLKTNVIDVKDGYSLDCENVFQDLTGVISKRRGNEVMFDEDEPSASIAPVDEIGSAVLSGTKYWFNFVGGNFQHSTSRTGTKTVIGAVPAISTTNQIFWAVLDDKLFFVDGTNELRFFDPAISTSAIFDSVVYDRPTVAPTSSGGAGFDYIYTVEKGFSSTSTSAESASSPLVTGASAATITVTGAFGPATIAVNDRIRIYSRSNAVTSAYKNVTPTSGAHANGVYETGPDGGGYLRITSTAASYAVVTVAINDDQPNLFSDLGVVLNSQAPTGLTGIAPHYGRLVGWKDDTVYNSKVSNPHSWPSDTVQFEAFRYTVGEGDGEDMQRCISFQESLYVFKKTKIFVFGGIGPDDTGANAYSFRRLETNGIGLIAPKSAVVIGEEQSNYLVWLSRNGFYASNGSMPVRVGENIETQIFGQSEANLQSAVAIHHKRDGLYLCFLGISSNRLGYTLDLREDKGLLTGWFKFTDLPVKSIHWDDDRYIFGAYTGYSGSERIAGLSTDYSDVKIEHFLPADVNTATDEITVALSYETGDPVVIRNSQGGAPGGLTENTTYFVIRVSATLIKLATTAANASGGIAIDITSQGTGFHTIVGSKAIEAFYTTNWLKFDSTSYVKKLGKLQLIFDATAESIELDVSFAYDWIANFQDTVSVTIASSHAWGSGSWGSFAWGAGANAVPKSVATSRRKIRSIRYKFQNNELNQDFNLQSIEVPFDFIRNRDNFAS